MNKMKKLIIVVTSLIAMIVVLVGCSNEKINKLIKIMAY